MMVNRKLIFFGALCLVWAGAILGVYDSPVAGGFSIAFGGVLLCEIMLGGKGGTL